MFRVQHTGYNLRLVCAIDIRWVAGRIFLPLLKTRTLDSVRVCSGDFEVLLNALPALEELDLVGIPWPDTDVTVSSASLETLTIKLCDVSSSLSFDLPRLVYIEYIGLSIG
uniref:Putative F-box protein n=1 Tax=Noccaea caerulescens TaxID=107243 RepID=A0A1J3FXE8_NOCCA